MARRLTHRSASVVRRGIPTPVKRGLRAVRRRLDRRGRTASAYTEMLVGRFCTGAGLEIGPGLRPYGPQERTVFVDRYTARLGEVISTDLVADGAELPAGDETVDFLISAHMLEHHPDPLAVLVEWQRVLRDGGRLVLVLPHGERTFDRGRPFSDIERLRAVHGRPHDPENPLNWDDFEQFSMSIEHPWLSDPEARRSDDTWDRRWIADMAYIHYHVWTQHEMIEILAELGFRILFAVDEMPDRYDSFMVVAETPGRDTLRRSTSQ